MKRTISNPHKVTHKTYIVLTIVATIALIISLIIPSTAAESSLNSFTIISEVIRNLSYGCIASTLVAWIIDCVNTKNLNKKANAIYDTVYSELKWQIGFCIASWAELCSVCFKDCDYYEQKNTWLDWYLIVKTNYSKADTDRQQQILPFFYDHLSKSVEAVNRAIAKIQSQLYILTVNDAMNEKMDQILSDLQFEFYACSLDLSHRDASDCFWENMDAIVADLKKYISNWLDIQYYNFLRFKPYKFWNDKNDVLEAIKLCVSSPMYS